jgi:hypothetical protein
MQSAISPDGAHILGGLSDWQCIPVAGLCCICTNLLSYTQYILFLLIFFSIDLGGST